MENEIMNNEVVSEAVEITAENAEKIAATAVDEFRKGCRKGFVEGALETVAVAAGVALVIYAYKKHKAKKAAKAKAKEESTASAEVDGQKIEGVEIVE